jgi:uncharacterized protein
MRVRALERGDWPAVISLNEESVSELSALDAEGLRHLISCAHCALVAEDAGEVVAFALAIPPGRDYESPNYRWFGERFERFLYLDRIAVDSALRRRRIGAQLYDEMESAARAFGRMVCEVNLEPRNDASLAFHEQRGYREVGRLELPQKLVALLVKELGESSADL